MAYTRVGSLKGEAVGNADEVNVDDAALNAFLDAAMPANAPHSLSIPNLQAWIQITEWMTEVAQAFEVSATAELDDINDELPLLQPKSEKGQPSGYASLDSGGKVPSSQLPAISVNDIYPVASQAAMLALSAIKGDIAIRSDINATFILSALPASTLANWLQLPTAPDAVLSVDGATGVVVLPTDAAANVGSKRTLGTGPNQAAAGNDARLSDQRVPTDGSVTVAKLAAGVLDVDPTLAADSDLMVATQKAVKAFVASAINAAASSTTVTQTAHGFAVGDVVKFNTNYAKAKADTPANAEVVGIVKSVTNANTFVVTPNGFITGLSGLTAGEVYFLSDTTAGQFTATEPTTIGHVRRPVLLADSTTSGWVLPYNGIVLVEVDEPPPIVYGFTVIPAGGSVDDAPPGTVVMLLP